MKLSKRIDCINEADSLCPIFLSWSLVNCGKCGTYNWVSYLVILKIWCSYDLNLSSYKHNQVLRRIIYPHLWIRSMELPFGVNVHKDENIRSRKHWVLGMLSPWFNHNSEIYKMSNVTSMSLTCWWRCLQHACILWVLSEAFTKVCVGYLSTHLKYFLL